MQLSTSILVGNMVTFHVDQTKFALELGAYAMQYLTLQSSLDWVQKPSIHHTGIHEQCSSWIGNKHVGVNKASLLCVASPFLFDNRRKLNVLSLPYGGALSEPALIEPIATSTPRGMDNGWMRNTSPLGSSLLGNQSSSLGSCSFFWGLITLIQ